MKRIFSLLGAVCLTAFFVACNNSSNTESNITPQDTTVNNTDHTKNAMASDTSGSIKDSLHRRDSVSH